MPKQPILYAPFEQPDVEVLIDGTWWPGNVRMVSFAEDDSPRHHVQYQTPDSNALDVFTDDRVRADTVDRSRGRLT